MVAVADPRPEAAGALASAVGAAAEAEPARLLDDPDIEAIVITASSEAHTDLIVAAAARGKAVFCEKPMAMSLTDADRAIAAAQTAAVPLQVGFNRRFAPDFAAARQLIIEALWGRRN